MESASNRSKRIPVWVVDDNRGFCLVLSEALNQSETVECTKCFHTCRTALQAMEEGPAPEVILLDIKMPRINGLDGIISFRKLSPSTQIIMLTSFDIDESVRTAMNRGASGYLLKSARTVEIISAIENVQKGGSPLDSMLTKKVMEAFLGENKENPYHLTKRERDILQFISGGMTVLEVAEKLNLSYYTVDTHVKNIFPKLNVHNRYELVAKATKERLV